MQVISLGKNASKVEMLFKNFENRLATGIKTNGTKKEQLEEVERLFGQVSKSAICENTLESRL